MRRKHNLRKIVSKRSYTTEEIAELLGVHTQTIRAWRKEGLHPIEANTSPFLFLGQVVKDFLANEFAKQKTKLQSNECYCLSCRKAVVPVNPQIIDRHVKLGNGKDSASLKGTCPICHHILSKFTTLEEQIITEQAVNQEVKNYPKVHKSKKSTVSFRQISLFGDDGEE